METDGALVVDLRKPDWASEAETLVREFAADPPKSLLFEGNDAAAPNAEEAQLIFALHKFAAAADVPVTLTGLADEFKSGMDRIGLTSVFSPEGDSAP